MKKLLLLSLGMMLLPLQVYGDLMTWGHLFSAVVGLGTGVYTERYYGLYRQTVAEHNKKARQYQQCMHEYTEYCQQNPSNHMLFEGWCTDIKHIAEQNIPQKTDRSPFNMIEGSYMPFQLSTAIIGGMMIDFFRRGGEPRPPIAYGVYGVVDALSTVSMYCVGRSLAATMGWRVNYTPNPSKCRELLNSMGMALTVLLMFPPPWGNQGRRGHGLC